MMDQMIRDFPQQLKHAISLGTKFSFTLHSHKINHVAILGMGGSGIGGDFVSSLVIRECKVPIITNKSYELPVWINQETLVIVSSYSGNTEETAGAMKEALRRGSKIVCISSGGIIAQMAIDQGLDHILLPSGISSPRTCLGYSIVQQLFVLYKAGLISDITIQNVKSAIDLLKFDQDSIMDSAREIARNLYGRTPVIYCADTIEPVALRWRQQINENSKYLAWHHVFPEMNHNELVGWKKPRKDVAVIMLRNRDDLSRTARRMDICGTIIAPLAGYYKELTSKGKSLMEKSMYLVHTGDWVSFYLAELNKVDPVEISVIDNLKRELGKF